MHRLCQNFTGVRTRTTHYLVLGGSRYSFTCTHPSLVCYFSHVLNKLNGSSFESKFKTSTNIGLNFVLAGINPGCWLLVNHEWPFISIYFNDF